MMSHTDKTPDQDWGCYHTIRTTRLSVVLVCGAYPREGKDRNHHSLAARHFSVLLATRPRKIPNSVVPRSSLLWHRHKEESQQPLHLSVLIQMPLVSRPGPPSPTKTKRPYAHTHEQNRTVARPVPVIQTRFPQSQSRQHVELASHGIFREHRPGQGDVPLPHRPPVQHARAWNQTTMRTVTSGGGTSCPCLKNGKPSTATTVPRTSGKSWKR